MERKFDKSIFMKPLVNTSTESEATQTTIDASELPVVEQPKVEINKETGNVTIHNTPEYIVKEVPIISLKNLNHTFDEGKPYAYQLFKNFNLDIPDFPERGQMISIMGGSGCGKSCILRIIAGLMQVQSGSVEIYGKTLKEYGNIPMVFQQYSNYEWMSVLDNVALPMTLKGTPKKEAHEKAMELIKLVGLEEHANKYAKNTTLSGGQLQRISIARCLASGSQIMLLDEATGALDIKMKREIQDLLLKIYYDSSYDPTVISVTHNVDEALYTSNRVIVLKANPCTIHTVLDIDYDEQVNGRRGSWVMESNRFAEYNKELTKALDEVCVSKK